MDMSTKQTDDSNSGPMWYPSPPPQELPRKTEAEIEQLQKLPTPPPALPEEHEVWRSGSLKYTTANKWQSIPMEKREAARRHRIHGVEIRLLTHPHFLKGEHGLFATQRFSRFDILGEYTGKIVGSEASGHYVAALEDKGSEDSLGIDAQTFGSELRFINSYLNVAFKPNVTMRTAYVNTYPHIVLVCCEDIEVGDEFLLDYGEGYNSVFLRAKPKTEVIPATVVRRELPGCGSDSSDSDSDDSELGDRTTNLAISSQELPEDCNTDARVGPL